MRKKPPPPPPPAPPTPTTTPPLQGVRLPMFSGSNTRCAACGHNDAYTRHAKAGNSCEHPGEGTRVVWGQNRLHRTCMRCGFSWDEACVPAIPQEINETMVMPVVRATRRGR